MFQRIISIALLGSTPAFISASSNAGEDATALADTSSAPSVQCRNIEGSFHLSTYSGVGCSSTQGLCGRVEWRGDLRATSEFVATSTTLTADTPTTGVVLVTGDAVVTVGRRGTLMTKDAVVLRTLGAGDFAEVDTIVGGSGAFAGVSGAWRAWGTFQNNSGDGRYEGQLCF
ncbi:MAG TPA: hypothetical protein VHM70_29775 [Polyangiaceae bacterium]|jgi:hypothetical protein|nr:hypothetical protein [Polyangiaceae bacterium]